MASSKFIGNLEGFHEALKETQNSFLLCSCHTPKVESLSLSPAQISHLSSCPVTFFLGSNSWWFDWWFMIMLVTIAKKFLRQHRFSSGLPEDQSISVSVCVMHRWAHVCTWMHTLAFYMLIEKYKISYTPVASSVPVFWVLCIKSRRLRRKWRRHSLS